MPSKRDVLALPTRDEQLAIVDRFELAPPDPHAKEGLFETVASSRKTTLADALPDLSRNRLKELCRQLFLDDSGRDKAEIVTRLVNGRSHADKPPIEQPKLLPLSSSRPVSNGAARNVSRSPPPIFAHHMAGTPIQKRPPLSHAPTDTISLYELQSHLWEAANILRGDPVDRTDLKSFILPLLFFRNARCSRTTHRGADRRTGGIPGRRPK